MRIRKMYINEIELLKDFLYEAIFIPKGATPPSRDIVYQPELRIYYEGFGLGKADYCFAAEDDDRMVGAVWTRIMNDYGHIDADIPSFAISLFPRATSQAAACSHLATAARIKDSVACSGVFD